MEAKRKHSRKRQAMLDALCSTHEHPTAEMLYNQLKPDYPELSLGTVYRNLSVLTEEGLAASIGNVNGYERYDAVTQPHAHFICRKCFRVMDLDLPDVVSEMYAAIDSDYHCQSDSYTLSISGLCDRCR